MKNTLLSLICAISVAGVSFVAFADTPTTTSPSATVSPPSQSGKFKKFKEMTPEERMAHRKDVKQKWDNLSPQEQAAFKEKNKDKLEKMRGKSDERNVLRLYGAELHKQNH